MKSHLMDWLLAILLLLGISMAGSDGPHFPCVNLAGAALLGLFFLLAQKYERDAA